VLKTSRADMKRGWATSPWEERRASTSSLRTVFVTMERGGVSSSCAYCTGRDNDGMEGAAAAAAAAAATGGGTAAAELVIDVNVECTELSSSLKQLARALPSLNFPSRASAKMDQSKSSKSKSSSSCCLDSDVGLASAVPACKGGSSCTPPCVVGGCAESAGGVNALMSGCGFVSGGSTGHWTPT